MSPVTVIWSMVSAACLTLAAVQGLVWWFDRTQRGRLAFAVMAVSTALMALIEIPMMKSAEPAAFATALRWQHVPVLGIFACGVAFVRLHLRAGRPWLGWTAIVVRSISLVLDFTVGVNLNYLEATGMREGRFLGDTVWFPEGTRNYSMLVGQTALLLLIWFVVDASITAWRRGDRRRAALTGGGIVAFVLFGSGQAILSHWQVLRVPAVAGHWFTGLIIIMALELSFDALHAAKLAQELRETQERERREVAHLGRVAVMGDMSASLAHEINQPLGTILMNAQAAQRLLTRDQPDLDEVRSILGDIVSEDLRAGAVIKRLREMLKRGDIHFEPVQLSEIVEGVLLLVRNLMRAKNIPLTKECPGGLPAVSGDRVQLQQVLLNLVLNACDAMESTPEASRCLRISLRTADGNIELDVTDSGCGLPADTERLFEPFYTTKDHGLGMGLAISRSIVASHRGRLVAVPAPAGGATFRVILPAQPQS